MPKFAKRLTICLCFGTMNTVAEPLNLELVCEIFPSKEMILFAKNPERSVAIDHDGGKGFLKITYTSFESPIIGTFEPVLVN